MFDLLNIHLFHDASNLVSIELVSNKNNDISQNHSCWSATEQTKGCVGKIVFKVVLPNFLLAAVCGIINIISDTPTITVTIMVISTTSGDKKLKFCFLIYSVHCTLYMYCFKLSWDNKTVQFSPCYNSSFLLSMIILAWYNYCRPCLFQILHNLWASVS